MLTMSNRIAQYYIPGHYNSENPIARYCVFLSSKWVVWCIVNIISVYITVIMTCIHQAKTTNALLKSDPI